MADVEEESLAPLMAFGDLIQEELDARGWTRRMMASRMGKTSAECGLHLLAVEMAMCVTDKNLLMDDGTANALGRAFGVSPRFFKNLYESTRLTLSASATPEGPK